MSVSHAMTMWRAKNLLFTSLYFDSWHQFCQCQDSYNSTNVKIKNLPSSQTEQQQHCLLTLEGTMAKFVRKPVNYFQNKLLVVPSRSSRCLKCISSMWEIDQSVLFETSMSLLLKVIAMISPTCIKATS